MLVNAIELHTILHNAVAKLLVLPEAFLDVGELLAIFDLLLKQLSGLFESAQIRKTTAALQAHTFFCFLETWLYSPFSRWSSTCWVSA
jgi:hypothetical protein